MTNHIKKIFSFLSICIIFGISGCETEKEITINQDKYSIKEYSFKEILKEPKFQNVFSTIMNGLKQSKNTNTIENSGNIPDFTIDENKIKKITKDEYTSYSMLVVRPITNENYFENLVLEIDSTKTIKAFLIKYTHSEKMLYNPDHQAYEFIGTSEINEIEYDPTVFMPFVANDIFCYNVLMCNYGGHEHLAGAKCTSVYVTQVCESSGGGGGGGTGGGGSSTSTSTSTTTTTTTATVTPPVTDSDIVYPHLVKN